MKPAASISILSRINRQQKAALVAMGLETIRDLLYHFPFRYEGFIESSSLVALDAGMDVSVMAQVTKIRTRRAFHRRGLSISEAELTDGHGTVTAIWFNQPYLTRYLKEGGTYKFAGKVSQTKYGLRLSNPIYESASVAGQSVRELMPVYPLSSGITQFSLRKFVRQAMVALEDVHDHLDEDVLADVGLMSLSNALRSIHFPESVEEAEAARRRLAFDDLLLAQIAMGRTKIYRQRAKAPIIKFDRSAVAGFSESLPFTLTDDQRRSAWEAIRDMERGVPMNRLLNGDVGSGKTAVAAVLAVNLSASGRQTAIMAPTEILAMQHFRTLGQLMGQDGPSLALVTNAYRYSFVGGQEAEYRGKSKREHLAGMIKSGEIDVVVGTHALIEKGLDFFSLGLVVIDEQHRFGVRTRQSLKDKGSSADTEPHLLSMTATPIPRSLELAMYGDLDVSLLKEKPGARKPILTKVVPPRARSGAYAAVREQIERGRQAFVVCPLIDPSDMLGVTSVTEEYERLKKEVFPDLEIAMLHGRLAAAEKEDIMARFKSGEVSVLVSTSVIEVGVDVPNATVMCIEGADRFGLAQLHQFRGRVGRSDDQSYCYLFPATYGVTVRERLGAMEKTNDGFELAEKDLAMRGPGDILGAQQSGHVIDLKLASAVNMELVRNARNVAATLLEGDPELTKRPALRAFVGDLVREAHLE
jgi:ATP-dependent DNA helicase RecG